MSAESPHPANTVMFENSPKLSEHEVDAPFNERRTALARQLKSFIAGHDRFRGEQVSVNFMHAGVSSLVATIEANNEKTVLKIPLSLTYARGETDFLRVWEAAGVRTPRVIEEGTIGEHGYILMEYIDAPTLSEAFTPRERIENGVYREMGRTLRQMHTPEAQGYGPVVEGKAEFARFDDWLQGVGIENRIAYVHEQSLIGEEHGSASWAIETLERHVAENPISSYCHDDFGGSNLFATTPLTVFDPNPRFNNAYVDLGRTSLLQISGDVNPTQLLTGYFAEDSYDEGALQAAILLNAYMKFPYWHKVKKMAHIQRVRDYLAISSMRH